MSHLHTWIAHVRSNNECIWDTLNSFNQLHQIYSLWFILGFTTSRWTPLMSMTWWSTNMNLWMQGGLQQITRNDTGGKSKQGSKPWMAVTGQQWITIYSVRKWADIFFSEIWYGQRFADINHYSSTEFQWRERNRGTAFTSLLEHIAERYQVNG